MDERTKEIIDGVDKCVMDLRHNVEDIVSAYKSNDLDRADVEEAYRIIKEAMKEMGITENNK